MLLLSKIGNINVINIRLSGIMNMCDGLPIIASCTFMENDTLKWLTNLNRGKPEADIFTESLPVTNFATSSGKALFQNKSHFLLTQGPLPLYF